jgi:hypothetical protein
MAKKKSTQPPARIYPFRGTTSSSGPTWPFSVSLERVQRLKHRDLEVIDGVMAAQVDLYEAYYAIERGAPLTAAQRKILQRLNSYRKAAGEAPIKRRLRRGAPALRLIRGGGSHG